jgi:hypothetical protein
MDPLTGAIVAFVFMLIFRHVVTFIIGVIFFIGATALIEETPVGGVILALVGVVATLGWEFFAIVQIIGDFIRIVQLAS